MAKNSVAGLLTSVDDLFSTQESRDEAKLERVINLSPDEISDFPNHPFKVRMDEEMLQMVESIKQHGVLVLRFRGYRSHAQQHCKKFRRR